MHAQLPRMQKVNTGRHVIHTEDNLPYCHQRHYGSDSKIRICLCIAETVSQPNHTAHTEVLNVHHFASN